MSKYIITYMQILGRREARILTLSGPVVLLHVSDMEIGCDGLLWALKEQADLADILQAYLSYLAHNVFQCFHSRTLFSFRLVNVHQNLSLLNNLHCLNSDRPRDMAGSAEQRW